MPAHVQNFDGDDGRAGRNAGNDLDDPAGSGGDGAGHFDVSKKMNQHELLDAMQAGNSGPKATAAGINEPSKGPNAPKKPAEDKDDFDDRIKMILGDG